MYSLPPTTPILHEVKTDEPAHKVSRRRRKAKGHVHSEMPHIDEKWLVSYADLMTLLFGLFVMLYSMALETQGEDSKLNEKLSQMLQGSFSKAPAQVTERKPAQEDLQKTIAEAEAKSKEQQKQIEAKVAELEQLKKENTEIKAEKEKVESKNAAADSAEMSIMVMAQWTTSDDVDLEVRSPKGNWFNFKNRQFSGDKNEFIQDSTKGPGAEFFKAVTAGGSYEFKVRLYNYQSESAKTEVVLKAVLPSGVKVLKTVSLSPEHREETFKVDLHQLH